MAVTIDSTATERKKKQWPKPKTGKPVDRLVGTRIRMRRMMLGISQETLGHGLGLTFQQVQKYEKGTNRVGASRLSAIATILKVHPSFFFEGGEDAEAVLESNALAATSDGLRLAKSIASIKSRSLRGQLIDLIETLAAKSEKAKA
jgi:transcriptional regulator with XRE-family HTH domain